MLTKQNISKIEAILFTAFTAFDPLARWPMAGNFKRADVDKLLAQCHRRCCICHRYCGVKCETDHMIPGSDGGTDDIDNAIVTCFECHAEIHSYNDKHPRGRKFHPEELREHKRQWLELCKARPEILVTATHVADVGPLQALIDELEFNHSMFEHGVARLIPSTFHDEQFRRAIGAGALSLLHDDLKVAIFKAYAAMHAANNLTRSVISFPLDEAEGGYPRLSANVSSAWKLIFDARNALLTFLSNK